MKKHIIAVLCISAVSALAGAVLPDLTASDSVALAVIAFAVYAAIFHMRHRKKGCCGSCSGCAFQGDCEKKTSPVDKNKEVP